MTGAARSVLVVGGGLAGTALAWQLVRRGHPVTLLDQGLTDSASRRSFGWVNSAGDLPREYHDLRREAQLRWSLEALRTDEGWYHLSGTLDWTYGTTWSLGPGLAQAETAEQAYRRRLALGHDVELVTASRAAELEPQLAAGAFDGLAIHARDEGWIDIEKYLAVTREKFRTAGGRIVEQRVTGLTARAGAVIGVTLDGPDRSDGVGTLHADVTVVAAGDSVPELLAGVGVTVPSASTAGVVIHTAPLSRAPQLILRGAEVGIRRLPNNGLNLHDHQVEKLYSATGEIPEQAVADALTRAAGLLRVDEPLIVDQVLAGPRPIPADGLPVVGEFAEPTGLAVLFTHSGVTLGLLLAEYLAAELATSGLQNPRLDGYRPDRFAVAAAGAERTTR